MVVVHLTTEDTEYPGRQGRQPGTDRRLVGELPLGERWPAPVGRGYFAQENTLPDGSGNGVLLMRDATMVFVRMMSSPHLIQLKGRLHAPRYS